MNPYKILGVSEDTPIEEVKKVYRKLCVKHHPDNGGDKDTFDRINKAYTMIKDGSFFIDIEKPIRVSLRHMSLFNFSVS